MQVKLHRVLFVNLEGFQPQPSYILFLREIRHYWSVYVMARELISFETYISNFYLECEYRVSMLRRNAKNNQKSNAFKNEHLYYLEFLKKYKIFELVFVQERSFTWYDKRLTRLRSESGLNEIEEFKMCLLVIKVGRFACSFIFICTYIHILPFLSCLWHKTSRHRACKIIFSYYVILFLLKDVWINYLIN